MNKGEIFALQSDRGPTVGTFENGPGGLGGLEGGLHLRRLPGLPKILLPVDLRFLRTNGSKISGSDAKYKSNRSVFRHIRVMYNLFRTLTYSDMIHFNF